MPKTENLTINMSVSGVDEAIAEINKLGVLADSQITQSVKAILDSGRPFKISFENDGDVFTCDIEVEGKAIERIKALPPHPPMRRPEASW